jgi:hypothetical protein
MGAGKASSWWGALGEQRAKLCASRAAQSQWAACGLRFTVCRAGAPWDYAP